MLESDRQEFSYANAKKQLKFINPNPAFAKSNLRL